MTEEPGSERWNWLVEGNAKQARKRVSVDLLIQDEEGNVLLVDPSYKSKWDLPGGMSEMNEPPIETAKREIREEIGLDVEPKRLLTVDWVAPHGPWDDILSFIFDGGMVHDLELANIRTDSEILQIGMFAPDQAILQLPAYMASRLQRALYALSCNETMYTEVSRTETEDR